MLYLSPGRFPSARAHSRQAAEMCAAFAATGARVTLAHPDLPSRPPAPRDGNLWSYYGLPRSFRALPLPCPGLPEIFGPEPDLESRLWRMLAHGTAAASAIARLYREPRREPLLVLSREKYAAFLAPRLVSRPNLRVLLEVHDLWRPLSRLDRALLTGAHGLVVIHPALRDDLGAEGIAEDRILVEPDGVRDVGSAPSRGEARRALGLEPGGLRIVYTGHLYPSKGVEVLVHAMSEIPEATALIVGGTSRDRARVSAEIRSPNVRLTGHVSPADTALYQAAADVLVLPTRPLGPNATLYTSPLKLAEYRAARRPIVASNVPSLGAWLRHDETAWLVPPEDPGALARGLRTVLADPDRGERLARNARRGLENETWEARARRILAFARRLPVLLALAMLLLGCRATERATEFPLAIRGRDLVREGPESTVILRGIAWDSGRPSADVLYPLEVIAAPRGGAVVLVENRRTLVVAVRPGPGGALTYASALEAPSGVRVDLAPDGTAMLIISENDRYLPEGSAYRLNRGVLHVDLEALRWHPSIRSALDRDRRDARWYARAGERYVPKGPIRVTVLEWRGSSGRIRILPREGPEQILTFP